MHKIILLTLALSLDVLCGTAQAQTPTAASFFRSPDVIEAKLSPGGKRLAFSTSVGGDRITVAVLDIEGGGKIYRPAGFGEADVIDFDWASDDRLVFSGMDLHDLGSDMGRRAPGLFSVSFDGKRPRVLVHRGNSFVRSGDDTALQWNHKLLSVPKPQDGVTPDEVVIGQMHFEDKSLAGIQPLWLNVRTGNWHGMDVGRAPPDVLHWWFDSAGNARVAFTSSKGRAAYHWRGPGESTWRRIAEGDALAMPFYISSVDDAGHLFVVAATGPGGTDQLTRFDFTTLKPAEKPLVATPGFDFHGGLLTDKPGASALGVRVDADGETTVWFDPALRALQEEIDAKLPGRVNRISCRSCGAPDMVALVRSYSDRDPGTLFLYDAAARKLQFLIKVQPGIDPKAMANVDFQRIKARDGRDLPVWLTLPKGVSAGQPAPTVVMVHGGPWARIGHWQWEAMNQFLAAQGWLVIEPEFRGSEGYGDAHFRAGFKQWGQAMEDDLADALLWAQKQGLAKPGKACIAGASYGGYGALMGPVRFPELFGCVAAWAGVADLNLFLEGSFWTQDDISNAGRKYGLPQMVGDTEKDAAMLRANNPVLLADRMKAPVMLVYGEADLRVPVTHGKRMRDALKAAGNPPEWFTYPGEGHGWTNPENRVDFAERLVVFLRKHLQ